MTSPVTAPGSAPSRHWASAECSLSTGSSRRRSRAAACQHELARRPRGSPCWRGRRRRPRRRPPAWPGGRRRRRSRSGRGRRRWLRSASSTPPRPAEHDDAVELPGGAVRRRRGRRARRAARRLRARRRRARRRRGAPRARTTSRSGLPRDDVERLHCRSSRSLRGRPRISYGQSSWGRLGRRYASAEMSDRQVAAPLQRQLAHHVAGDDVDDEPSAVLEAGVRVGEIAERVVAAAVVALELAARTTPAPSRRGPDGARTRRRSPPASARPPAPALDAQERQEPRRGGTSLLGHERWRHGARRETPGLACFMPCRWRAPGSTPPGRPAAARRRGRACRRARPGCGPCPSRPCRA